VGWEMSTSQGLKNQGQRSAASKDTADMGGLPQKLQFLSANVVRNYEAINNKEL